MSIALNDIHVRAVKCWEALQAHPELLPLMKPSLKAALQQQVAKVGPALKLVSHKNQEEDEALSTAEKTLAGSRDMMMQLHDGARYRYRHHADQLRALSPLKVGRDPAEDEVRLATLERQLPGCRPAFLWLSDEGLTHAALKKQLAAHRAAAKVEAATGTAEKEAFKLLRDQRPASHLLWDEDGHGLEAWVIANVPRDQQYAFGRERRKQPRTKSGDKSQQKSGDKKTQQQGGDQKTGGDTPPADGTTGQQTPPADAPTSPADQTEAPAGGAETPAEKKTA